ncbi:GCG_CRPN prefix-to-repeats domain-containing protein [Bradyrhizobium ivorense]|uniref:GCG_CRPN prefix-to-repeats domain-containing protein n=1 Tax=Bradyrhizobium ivorense TaxID=2511166 RepID=UPI003D315484
MKTSLLACLTAVALLGYSPAHAADGCGVGCHATVAGACVIDGWGTPGLRVRNQCPATTRPRPPCGGGGFVWRRDWQACAQTTKDWL